ncbi:hypothetical protein [uncultured Clostridium sp.]|uniref:hypothetical protein n=1 Tax=uncultured Clostridium sp. TaxID=59620 RepID=UPI0025E29B1D|nr:hypothetical protein [uncultured Clostridium sp.]MDU4884978.1 hypothetical protein [Clostridium celatum]MDU7078163.1 hypothetical protein [Clostridium celatum]
MQNSNIEKLVIDYLENNVVESIKEEFLNAAIHFIINEEICSKEDILRIKYRFKKIKSNEVIDYIKLSVTYGYILYRALVFNLVDENSKSSCCEAFLNISNEITKFITMEIDEEDLYRNIKLAISSLYIGDDCNNKVLEKFRGCSIVF